VIFIGVFPVLTRDIQSPCNAFLASRSQTLTLGASNLSLTYRIVLPQILPRLIEAIRLSLGSAWLFLIAAEAIAAEQGLGYRGISGATLPGDGRHSPVRVVDHAARLCNRLGTPVYSARLFSVVRSRRG